MSLDVIDKKLLALLQNDSKQTNKQLSNQLNLSVTAVYERIKRLERSGILKKYVALVDRKRVDRGFMVLCQIKLLQHAKDHLTTFENEVQQLDEVIECLHITGDYDYVLKILVKDMDAYREFLVNKLTTIKHIGSNHSTFVITEIKGTTTIPV